MYELELTSINRTNLTEESLDRDPLAIKWKIEAEAFNKSLFTLMRTNLSNLLTNRLHMPKVKLLVENKEPAEITTDEIDAFKSSFEKHLDGLNPDQ